jgi:hypothetical protein
MPQIYKLTFIYNAGLQGFSEVFYRSADTAQAATQITQTRINKFIQMRIGGVVLVALKATEVGGLRRSYIRTLNEVRNAGYSGSPLNPQIATPDVTAVCAQIRLGFEGGGSRIVNVRALGDVETIRNQNFIDNPSGVLRDAINNYLSAVTPDFLGQKLVDSSENGFPWIPVASLEAHPTNSSWTRVNVLNNAQINAANQLVYFSGVDRAVFPGLRGQFRVVEPPTATTFTIPYRYREAVALTTVRNMNVRRAVYTYPALVGRNFDDTFVRLTTRKTGRPFGLLRGRASGLRLRQ